MPLSCVIVPGRCSVPSKSLVSGVIEILAPESQITGHEVTVGPSELRMRAGACKAIVRVDVRAMLTCKAILRAACIC